MKAQFRRLPHINQLYQRRKSYQLHLKKMNNIKLAKEKLKLHVSINNPHDINHSQIKQHQPTCLYTQQSQIIKHNQLLSNSIIKTQHSHEETIKFQIQKLPNIHQSVALHQNKNKKWMSPHSKRVQKQIKAENMRLKKRVNSTQLYIDTKISVSLIGSRKSLQANYQRYNLIKRRISRYSINPQTSKIQFKTQKSLEKIQAHHKVMTQNSKSKVSLHQQTNNKSHIKPVSKHASYSIPYKKSSQKQVNINHSIKSVNISKLINEKRKQNNATETTPINRFNISKKYEKSMNRLQNSQENILKVNQTLSLSSKKKHDLNSKSLNHKPISFYYHEQILKNKIEKPIYVNKNIKQHPLKKQFINKVKQAKMIYKYQTKSQRPSLNKFQYNNQNRYNINQTTLSKINLKETKIQVNNSNRFAHNSSKHQSSVNIYNEKVNQEIIEQEISVFPTEFPK